MNNKVQIEIAGIRISMHPKYKEMARLARDYLVVDEKEPADISLLVSEEEIDYFEQITDEVLPRGYHETTAFLDVLCNRLLDFDAYFLHAAVVAVDEKGFAFSARSGTGKSTHVKKWLEYFGERAKVVNGDKPFLFKRGTQLFASGTPWSGKEGWQTNTQVPLEGICFLERGLENRIRPARQEEIIDRLFPQIRLPKDPVKLSQLMDLLDWTIQHIPFYVLECTISKEAAKVAYDGMTKD